MSRTGKFRRMIAGLLGSAVAASSMTVANIGTTVSAADGSNYLEALALSLYMYDANACGTGVTGGPLTWRGDCHTYDAKASVGSLSGAAKAAVDPDGDGKVDVSGGFHDAGDHVKFNLTIGFGLSSLAMSEYLNEGIYEKAGAKDHLIYELKWGADYLMKTTFLDGSGNVAAVAGTVADGTVDHGIWSAPEVQTYDRPVYWLTASDNNSAVCCEMAAGLAGTAYVVKDSDPAYAAECIKYSKALLSFAQKNVGNNCAGMSFYSTNSMYQDEEALAQAWLWILGEGSKPTRTPSGGDYGGGLYDGYLYCWDKVWQGYSVMMYKATGDSAFEKELMNVYSNEGGISSTSYVASGWGASRYNCAKQFRALALAKGDGNSEYAKAAKFQMDYILGNNSYGYSFLLGYGSKWPSHIHHRAANPGNGSQTSADNPSAKYTAYGMLVGGADKSGYEDHADRYQYTEGALDYNGCFALACAGLANIYGGDASAINGLVASASEINSDFVFGSGEIDPPKPTATTTTGSTTTTTTTTVITTKIVEEIDIAANSKELQVQLKEADELEITYSASSGVKFNGAIDYTDASGYKQIGSFDTTMDSSGKYTKSVNVSGAAPNNDTVTIHVWWSEDSSAVIDSVKRVYYKVVENTGTTTTTTTTTTSTTTSTTTTSQLKVTLWGDANCDKEVNMADAVLVMQYLSNPDTYGLGKPDGISELGRLNADVYDNGDGVTNSDASAIQEYKLGLKDTLPVSYKK